MMEPAGRSRRSIVAASVATAVALVILISLGFWQLNRLAWKEALIVTLQERLTAPPVPLPAPSAWAGLTAENAEFRRVSLEVDFSDTPPVYVYAGAPALRPDLRSPGYFVFAPVRLCSGETVVVNAGWVPPERTHPPIGGRLKITGYLRWPETSGRFVSDHDATARIWFVRDPASMARLQGWGPVAPFYVDMEAPLFTGGWPKPGPLIVNLRNNHLGYAWTWFGLAGTLAGVFIFWLYFGRRKTVNAEPSPSL